VDIPLPPNGTLLGVYKMGLEILKVSVIGDAGAKKAQVVYRVLMDGQPGT
jgi:hypothetical protein